MKKIKNRKKEENKQEKSVSNFTDSDTYSQHDDSRHESLKNEKKNDEFFLTQ